MPRYQLVDGRSSKFWEIELDGQSFITRYGRIGSDGQQARKDWPDAARAKSEYEKLVAEKVKKGYQLVEGAGAAPSKGAAPRSASKLAQQIEKLAAKLPGERTRIYILEAGKKAPAKDAIAAIGGPPRGVTRAARPALDGAPMDHLLTIDLAEIPELAARHRGKRALSLFVAGRNDNQAYEPHNGYTETVALTEAELQKGAPDPREGDGEPRAFLVSAVDVPEAVFAELDERPEDLEELRDAIYGAPGYALGSPIWLQGDEHEGDFILQFGEELVDVNLGDCGVMYVFEDTAFWQCS